MALISLLQYIRALGDEHLLHLAGNLPFLLRNHSLGDCEIRSMSLRLKPIVDEEAEATNPSTNQTAKKQVFDLGNGSEIVYISRFVSSDQGWTWFDYLDKQIPWTRPVLRVFGRRVVQPRDSCYVANSGLPELSYSGYRPHPYSWDDFPPLRDILDAVHKVLPGSSFNSLLLNRYKCGSDFVGWHSDDEKLYGLNHDIASLSFGCDREFLLRSKHKASFQERRKEEETASKRSKKSIHYCQHSFMLNHGSLLVMKGFTQRDWIHSIPKRAKAESIRINLTFRRIVS